MNRREFGKVTMGAVAVGMVAPLAEAATIRRPASTRSIIDCVIIDFDKSKQRWIHLTERDERGRDFIYEDTGETAAHRHFEFLGSDGLVVGRSSPMEFWTSNYQTLEDEFLTFYKVPGSKAFSRDEFQQYVDVVRTSLNGNYVPINALA
jgi:hypothetical protein